MRGGSRTRSPKVYLEGAPRFVTRSTRSLSDHLPVPEDGGNPILVSAITLTGTVCRCGTKLPMGSPCIEVLGLSSNLSAMFRGEAFCSPRCARAEFLEDLSVLDALDTPEAQEQVSDLREMYMHLVSAYSKLLDHSTIERAGRTEGNP